MVPNPNDPRSLREYLERAGWVRLQDRTNPLKVRWRDPSDGWEYGLSDAAKIQADRDIVVEEVMES